MNAILQQHTYKQAMILEHQQIFCIFFVRIDFPHHKWKNNSQYQKKGTKIYFAEIWDKYGNINRYQKKCYSDDRIFSNIIIKSP